MSATLAPKTGDIVGMDTAQHLQLGQMIGQLQARYILAAPPAEVFDPLLADLLAFTGSGYGFVAELLRSPDDGHEFLRVLVLTDISWNKATQRMFEEHRSGRRPIEFHNFQTLFGAAVRSGTTVIANDPLNDPRRGGLPMGHAPMDSFLGVPVRHGGNLVGMVGLSNRPGGYNEPLVEFMQPLFACVGAIIGAVKQERARSEAEVALRDSQQRLRDTFELAAVGIAHLAEDGRFLRVNQRLCETWGRGAPALLALRIGDLVLPPDDRLQADQLHRLFSGHSERSLFEARHRHADGHAVWSSLNLAAVRDASGAEQYCIAVIEDITGRKQAEAAMLSAQAAERANAAKTVFLSRMSHELRTPLNAVIGFAQLLRMPSADEPMTPGQQVKLGHIEAAGHHLLAMINEVLDLSRIESGNIPVSPQPVDMQRLAEETVAMLTGSAQASGVVLQLLPSPCGARVVADQVRLRQVLVNLLGNAVKYNRRGGCATLRWQADVPPGEVWIEVADDGPGLTSEQLDHLFEPFNRLGAERTGIEGTGIGLALTKALVTLMHGSLTVHSAPGEGSRFVVRLPAAASHAA